MQAPRNLVKLSENIKNFQPPLCIFSKLKILTPLQIIRIANNLDNDITQCKERGGIVLILLYSQKLDFKNL
jgi:hypothetical protein